jgi:hypothetical protein
MFIRTSGVTYLSAYAGFQAGIHQAEGSFIMPEVQRPLKKLRDPVLGRAIRVYKKRFR